MKNKFEYEYLEEEFTRLSEMIHNRNNSNRDNDLKVLSIIQSHYKNACIFIKERDEMIDELCKENISLNQDLQASRDSYNKLDLENDNLQTQLEKVMDEIYEIEEDRNKMEIKLDEYFMELEDLKSELNNK